MSENLHTVHVGSIDTKDYVEIQPEYVYMTIPAEYVCIYHKILIMMADFGVDMLKDCQASCTTKNKKVVDCFNMFNAAVAARKLGQDKLAKTLISYVKGQIDLNYNGESPSVEIVYPVDKEGKLKAMVGCGNYPKFTVDVETGKLLADKMENATTVFGLSESDYIEGERK